MIAFFLLPFWRFCRCFSAGNHWSSNERTSLLVHGVAQKSHEKWAWNQIIHCANQKQVKCEEMLNPAKSLNWLRLFKPLFAAAAAAAVGSVVAVFVVIDVIVFLLLPRFTWFANKTHPSVAPIYYISLPFPYQLSPTNKLQSGINLRRRMCEAAKWRKRKKAETWKRLMIVVGMAAISNKHYKKLSHTRSLPACLLFLASASARARFYSRIVCSHFMKYRTGILCLALTVIHARERECCW